jgi:oligopeptide/dipeptide ABC transporter ATP-binding protein
MGVATATAPLLEVRGLQTHFVTSDGLVRAVDGVDLEIRPGQTLGVVGESGCGKSVTALSIMRLLAAPAGRIAGGQILFEGRDLVSMPDVEMNRVRGARISMVFQEPMTSLNPLQRVGDQVAEALRLHEGLSARAGRDRTVEMFHAVGIPSPSQRYDAYAHELSGGMRQRVMIAMALACRPALLIADEPTTALDVTIQAQILDLLRDLQAELMMAVMLITHDLGVIAEMADHVAVMYAGRVVEQAPIHQLFDAPAHPYTQGLLSSIPTLQTPRTDRLTVIRGSVPNLANLPPGCAFAARCPHVLAKCRTDVPRLQTLPDQSVGAHLARCWLHSSD